MAYLVIEFSNPGATLEFEGENANKVENAIFQAESRGAEACSFEAEGKIYTIRLSNYLYRIYDK